jgi:hypothetical protein
MQRANNREVQLIRHNDGRNERNIYIKKNTMPEARKQRGNLEAKICLEHRDGVSAR